MKPEVMGPELSQQSGQIRLSNQEAIKQHIVQYATRSMVAQAIRHEIVDEIEHTLHTPGANKTNHTQDEINLTLIMIMDKRNDLAKKIWIDPEAFQKENQELCSLGLQRVGVELNHQQEWGSGKQIISQWEDALNAIGKSDS